MDSKKAISSMNKKTKELTFHLVQKKDHQMILEWLEKPYVKEFYYGPGLKSTLRNLDLYVNGKRHNGEYHFDFWIVCFNEKPFGLFMTSPIEGPYDPKDPYNKWFEEGKEIITLDLLIGEEAYLGRGLAKRMIREFLLDKFPNAYKFLIDPEINNKKATHVYEKVGFKKVEEFLPKGHSVPNCMMHLYMSELNKKG